MLVRRPDDRQPRRGVVLILILAMLGLLALIGVAFATFSSQAQIGARKYAEGASWPTHEDVMDFALSQLINDTYNPQSAIRFHSMKRDMYGSDATNNGILTALPGGGNLLFTSAGAVDNTPGSPTYGLSYFATNIPAGRLPGLYGYSFNRWTLKLAVCLGYDANANPIAPTVPPMVTTYEVLRDDQSTGFHVLYLSNPDPTTSLYNPLTGGALPNPGQGISPQVAASNNIPFALDGRYLHAFNGPGMNRFSNYPVVVNGQQQNVLVNQAAFADFRTNRSLLHFNPNNSVGVMPETNARGYQMDEDYDAPDLDNWFLGIQSADGTVVIPSFHRPGIIDDADWLQSPYAYSQVLPSGDPNYANMVQALMAKSKVLRPRRADGHDGSAFPDLVPDPITGQVTYDVDNTGDGVTDAVWLDLGYPIQRDANGKMFKPMFAITVLGLNGRLPLNTAGNLQGVLPANIVDTTGSSNPPTVYAYAGTPTYSHASHIGYSVNEINPLYALQNANDPTGTLFTQVDNQAGNAAITVNNAGTNGSVTGNPGLAVNVTQLRNLLTGTRPQPSLTSTIPVNGTSNYNGDQDFVLVNGHPWFLPNNVVDGFDTPGLPGPITRATPPVAGRWGESDNVPVMVSASPNPNDFPWPIFAFNNLIRAGRSNALALPLSGSAMGLPAIYMDATDDDFDSTDYGATVNNGGTPSLSGPPEANDVFEFNYAGTPAANHNTGAGLFASERIRRFVKPIDPSGNGRLMRWHTPPGNSADYGRGADIWGRVGYFNYFRPPGLPPTLGSTNGYSTNLAAFQTAYANNIPTGAYGYAPWVNAGNSPASNFGLPLIGAAPTGGPEMQNNPLHGYDAERVPRGSGTYFDPANGQFISQFAAMPFNNANGPNGPLATAPTFNPPINSIDYWAAFDINGSTNTGVFNGYPGGSFNHDEADEMNLYAPNGSDAPFGPHDLEWLYRKQDVDGAVLNSRLAQLAPISFLNPLDGFTRRNLFSVDTWDLTTFAFAIDNPGAYPNMNLFGFNDRGPGARFGGMGIDGFSYLSQYPNGLIYNPNLFPPNPNPGLAVPTPNIAHRDRKINLNFPLPASTSPVEPVRQKWIRETYQFLKATLPPESTDTPQELAQLSQFVVNIVDFRDPDATPTRFVNTDLVNNWPTTTAPARVDFAFTGNYTNRQLPSNGAFDVTYDPNADATLSQGPPPAYNPPFLVQYGMEYSPVAFNEVLAYSFIRNRLDVQNAQNSAGTPVSTRRLYIELVNTLVDGANNTANLTGYNFQPDVSDVDLTGWDIVLFPGDDYSCRPDPVTGAMPPIGNVNNGQVVGGIAGGVLPVFVPLRGPAYKASLGVANQSPYDPTVADHAVLSLKSNRQTGNNPLTFPDQKLTIANDSGSNRYYYVLGNVAPDPNSEQNQNPQTQPPYGGLPTTPFPPTNGTAYPMLGDTDIDQVMAANTNVVTTNGTTPVYVSGGDPNDVTFPFPAAYTSYNSNAPAQPAPPAPADYSGTSLFDPMQYFPTLTIQRDQSYQKTGPTTDTTMPVNPTTNTGSMYCWAYLRRPINPLDPTSPKVEVDAFRFSYLEAGGRVTYDSQNKTWKIDVGNVGNDNAKPVVLASTERQQPYRGGHAVSYYGQAGNLNVPAATLYGPRYPFFGYTEQANVSYNSATYPPGPAFANPSNYHNGWFTFPAGPNSDPKKNPPFATTFPINHTLREPNSADEHWDHFPFHDRDFQSVAELLLVPGCPPGLFTKQFAEIVPPLANPIPPTSVWATMEPMNGPAPVPVTLASAGMAALAATNYANPPIPNTNPITQSQYFFGNFQNVHTYPYLPDNFYYYPYGATLDLALPANGGYGMPVVGGPSGTGWHKMLGFFEVPSSANGAIGPVGAGSNFDWYRRDTRPGQLNMNLIIDEEVFFGLIDDLRLNLTPVTYLQTPPSPNGVMISSIQANGTPPTPASITYAGQAVTPTPTTLPPAIVTGYNSVAGVYHGYWMNANRGFVYWRDPFTGEVKIFPTLPTDIPSTSPATLPANPPNATVPGWLGNSPPVSGQLGLMKQAFSDFLKFTHGGSGFLFGYGNGAIGSNLPPAFFASQLAHPRPFHDLTYPDIDQTIMRPAFQTDGPARLATALLSRDPGLKFALNQTAPPSNLAVWDLSPPPIPIRRMFQIPDASGSQGDNAAIFADPNPNTSNYNNLTGLTANLIGTTWINLAQMNPNAEPALPPPAQLGPFKPGNGSDNREHPAFRNEWIQKLTNLTTVRTHQYACWITVGFFEVAKPGDPQHVVVDPVTGNPIIAPLPDILGPEVGIQEGKNVRYRNFCIIDRTKATGFNPTRPGDFDDLIVYRRRIE